MLVYFSPDQNKIWKKGTVYTDEANWFNDTYKWFRIEHIVYEIDFKNTMSD